MHSDACPEMLMSRDVCPEMSSDICPEMLMSSDVCPEMSSDVAVEHVRRSKQSSSGVHRRTTVETHLIDFSCW